MKIKGGKTMQSILFLRGIIQAFLPGIARLTHNLPRYEKPVTLCYIWNTLIKFLSHYGPRRVQVTAVSHVNDCLRVLTICNAKGFLRLCQVIFQRKVIKGEEHMVT